MKKGVYKIANTKRTRCKYEDKNKQKDKKINAILKKTETHYVH